MAKIAPSIIRTVYPIDYDKNRAHESSSFNNWAKYISEQVSERVHESDRLVVDAKKILLSQVKIK